MCGCLCFVYLSFFLFAAHCVFFIRLFVGLFQSAVTQLLYLPCALANEVFFINRTADKTFLDPMLSLVPRLV